MTRRETTAKRAMMTAAAPVVREHAEPPAPGWRRVLLHAVGLGLLIATGAIHLGLYLTGYRTIPAISRLFLLQVIAAFGLGLAAPAIPGRLAVAGGSRLRPRHPRRLPVGLDRAAWVHRGSHGRPHRRRPGGGGRFGGAGIVPGTPRLGATT
jgi:hypothetical protein